MSIDSIFQSRLVVPRLTVRLSRVVILNLPGSSKRDFIVFEKNYLVGVLNKGGSVGCCQGGPFTDAQNNRAATACHDDGTGMIHVHHRNPKRALHL